jgi:hypothetical protein
LPNNTDKLVEHGVSNIQQASLVITGTASNGSTVINLPHVDPDSLTEMVRLNWNSDNVNLGIETGKTWTSYQTYVLLEYSKTTDTPVTESETVGNGGLTTNTFQKISLLEQSADPIEPSDGETIIWMSDGTGKGDAGDVMIASNQGGTTRYTTLFDYSAGTAW